MDKNIDKTTTQEIVHGVYKFFKWVDKNMSEEQLGQYIGYRLKAPIPDVIPDFKFKEEDFKELEKYINTKNPDKSATKKAIKIIFQLTKTTVKVIKGLNLSEKHLKQYLGSLWVLYEHDYLRKFNMPIYFLLFLDIANAKKAIDKKEAKDILLGNFKSKIVLEKIGSFILKLVTKPNQAFGSAYAPIEKFLTQPVETIENTTAFIIDSIKDSATTNYEDTLKEISDKKYDYTLSGKGFSLKVTIDLQLANKDNPKINIGFDGGYQLALSEKEKWNLVFDANIGDLKIKFNPRNSKESSFDLKSDSFIEIALKKPDATNVTDNSSNKQLQFEFGKTGLSLNLKGKKVFFNLFSNDSGLVLARGESDSFIDSVLPKKPTKISANFNLVEKEFKINKSAPASRNLVRSRSESGNTKKPVEETGNRGFYAKDGKFGYEKKFLISKKLGPLDIKYLSLNAYASNADNKKGIIAFSATAFKFKLGPLIATVEEIGIQTSLLFPSKDEPEFDYGFKPPKGVGLALKSSIIKGGGFIEFDPKNHRYAGALSLNLFDLELTAIGLITTRLPNKQKGFSMLISISVIFNPSFQLGFGFTLNGVGGLIGIHRTMKVDVLKKKIWEGAIDSIMFPKNVIENAPKIISDLREIFPPKKGHFVVAPFLKIGWGTGTIVEVDLGVLVEIPFKGRLILIGGIGVYLPNKIAKKRIVELHIDIFGDFNFAKGYVLLEGRLRNSHVAGIPLKGGFAFMIDWGENPQFLFSIGGYHPRYKKPNRFPAIERLNALINKGNAVRLYCEYYQAITSNSFQIGLSADIVVKKGKAKATGFIGFNAMIQFDPFYFETDINIKVGVSYKSRTFVGVDLSFLLSGPKPWRAKGYARIKVWLFSLKIRFDVSWGGKQLVAPSTLKTLDILSNLIQQLATNKNWSGKIPTKYNRAATMRSLDGETNNEVVFMHPIGYLELRQTYLPLKKRLVKLGNSKIVHKKINHQPEFRISHYSIGSGKKATRYNSNNQNALKEYFARAEYEELSDKEKITRVDFELMSAGITMKSQSAYDFSSEMAATKNDIENITINSGPVVNARSIRSRSLKYDWQADNSKNFRGRQSDNFEATEAFQFGLVDELPVYEEKVYKIVSKENLEAPAPLTAKYFTSISAAEEYLAINDSADSTNLQIIEGAVLETDAPIYQNSATLEKIISFSSAFPQILEQFKNMDTRKEQPRYLPADFELTVADFSAGLIDLKTHKITVEFKTENGLPPMAIELNLNGIRGTNRMTYDGKVSSDYSRHGWESRWNHLLDTSPIGSWELALPKNETVKGWFKKEVITDIILTITYDGKLKN